jgi:hypothetical protein
MITVVKGAEPELLHLQIRWQGGATETIDVRRQPNRAEASRSPAIEAGHFGGGGGLIDEDKLLRIKD